MKDPHYMSPEQARALRDRTRAMEQGSKTGTYLIIFIGAGFASIVFYACTHGLLL